MTKTEIKIESDKITDSLDRIDYDLGGFRGRKESNERDKSEPLFSIGRQFELMRLIYGTKTEKR